jgi:PHD/YefM family antitoxin component YafN of YafNO toxin-antitoxin module
MMNAISANELKTKGVSAIQTVLDQQTEAVISVRGKQRFVVMDIAHYQYLRECELSAAIIESKADMAEGRYVIESAEEHLARLESME